MERHGSRYLARAERLEHLAGEWRPDRLIVIRFPDRAALEDCFASEEYRAIRGLRLASLRSSAVKAASLILATAWPPSPARLVATAPS